MNQKFMTGPDNGGEASVDDVDDITRLGDALTALGYRIPPEVRTLAHLTIAVKANRGTGLGPWQLSTFDPSAHPRGQPKNAGQFAPTGTQDKATNKDPSTGDARERIPDHSSTRAAIVAAIAAVPAPKTNSPIDPAHMAHNALRRAQALLDITPEVLARIAKPAPPGKATAALSRALDVYSEVSPATTRAAEVYHRVGATALPQQAAPILAVAASHTQAVRGHIAASVAQHLDALADSLPPGRRQESDPKTVAKSLVLDLSKVPPEARNALRKLAAKTDRPDAFALGDTILLTPGSKDTKKLWRLLDESDFADVEPAREQAEHLWHASKAPIQVALADVPPEAKGQNRAHDPESGREDLEPRADEKKQYKRLTKHTYIVYDPDEIGEDQHRLIAADQVPEVVGIPAWAARGERPPENSGYMTGDGSIRTG